MRILAISPAPVKPYLKPRTVAPGHVFGQGILVERVNAGQWSRRICGRLWSVATDEQKRLAVAMLGMSSPDWQTIEPPGPSLDELAARLAPVARPQTLDERVAAWDQREAEIRDRGALVQDALLESLQRPKPYTVADVVEAAAMFGPETDEFEVIAAGLMPISGGSPEADVDGPESWGPETDDFYWELGPAVEVDVDDLMADELARMAMAIDRLSRGLDAGDSQCRVLIGFTGDID